MLMFTYTFYTQIVDQFMMIFTYNHPVSQGIIHHTTEDHTLIGQGAYVVRKTENKKLLNFAYPSFINSCLPLLSISVLHCVTVF